MSRPARQRTHGSTMKKNGKQITTPMSHEKRDSRLYLCQKHHSQGVIKTQYLLLMRCLYALIAIVFDWNIIYYTDNIYICAINERLRDLAVGAWRLLLSIVCLVMRRDYRQVGSNAFGAVSQHFCVLFFAHNHPHERLRMSKSH